MSVSTRAATRLLVCAALASPAWSLALVGPFAPVQRAPNCARAAVRAEEGGGVKVSIKAPSAKTAEAAEAAAPATSVKISVKAPSKDGAAAKAAAAPPAPAAAAASTMTTTVKVNAPTAAPAAPAAPAGPKRTPAEEELLAGTQGANMTRVLTALQDGANPNICDPKGRTPLHFSAGVGLAPAVLLLIHFGADMNARDAEGLTPLHMAAGYANPETMKLLIAAGADTTLVGEKQGTALSVVQSLGQYQWEKFYKEEKKGLQDRFKKKDEKLEKLRKCMDAFEVSGRPRPHPQPRRRALTPRRRHRAGYGDAPRGARLGRRAHRGAQGAQHLRGGRVKWPQHASAQL